MCLSTRVVCYPYSLDADIASGVYFSKREGELSEPLIFPEKGGGADRFKPNQVYPVWGHGMGLTLVKLDVYKRMADELDLGQDKYGTPKWYHTSEDDDIYQDENDVIHTAFTEDLWFCHNAGRLGYRPLINTHKHAFGFHYESRPVIKKDDEWGQVDLITYLEYRGEKQMMDYGYPDKQWRQYVLGQKITWDTPQGEVVWT